MSDEPKPTAENLKDKLFECLIEDMKDAAKRGPDLYKVVRETLRDHKGDLNALPIVGLPEEGHAPFRIGGTG